MKAHSKEREEESDFAPTSFNRQLEQQNSKNLYFLPSHSSMGALLHHTRGNCEVEQALKTDLYPKRTITKVSDEDAVKICEFPDEKDLNSSLQGAHDRLSIAIKNSPEEVCESLAGGVMVHHTQKASWSTLDGNIDSPINPASRHSPTGSGLASHLSTKTANLLNRIKSGELAFHQLLQNNSHRPQRKLKIRLKGKSDIPSIQVEADQKENTDPQRLQPTSSEHPSAPKMSKPAVSWAFGDVLEVRKPAAPRATSIIQKKQDSSASSSKPGIKARPALKGCCSRKLSAQASCEVNPGLKGHNPQSSGLTNGTLGLTTTSSATNRGTSQEWADEHLAPKTHDRHGTQQAGLHQRSSPQTKLHSPRETAYIKTQTGLPRTKIECGAPPAFTGSAGYYFIPTHLKSVSSPLGKLVHNSSRAGTERERESSSKTARTATSLWVREEEGKAVKKIVLSPYEARKLQQGDQLQSSATNIVQTPSASTVAWGVLDHTNCYKVDLKTRMMGAFKKSEQTWLAKVQERMSPNILLSKDAPFAASPRSARMPMKTLFSQHQSPVGSSKLLTFETYFDTQDAVCR